MASLYHRCAPVQALQRSDNEGDGAAMEMAGQLIMLGMLQSKFGIRRAASVVLAALAVLVVVFSLIDPTGRASDYHAFY